MSLKNNLNEMLPIEPTDIFFLTERFKMRETIRKYFLVFLFLIVSSGAAKAIENETDIFSFDNRLELEDEKQLEKLYPGSYPNWMYSADNWWVVNNTKKLTIKMVVFSVIVKMVEIPILSS